MAMRTGLVLGGGGVTGIAWELRPDGTYASVRIADDSSAETIAGQLKVLAESITRKAAGLRREFQCEEAGLGSSQI